MSKELIKLPREVAEAIEQVRLNYKSGCEYDLAMLNRERYGKMDAIVLFADESRENMMLYFKALVNGYRIEQTPEDMIRFKYDSYISSDDRKYRGMAIGLKEAVEILNIKIEGVNA